MRQWTRWNYKDFGISFFVTDTDKYYYIVIYIKTPTYLLLSVLYVRARIVTATFDLKL